MSKFLPKFKGGDHHRHHQQQQQQAIHDDNQMGQFSSSEVQAATAVAGKAAVLSSAAVIGTENASEVWAAESLVTTTAGQERRPSAVQQMRPSQPIDILRGQQQCRPRFELAAVQQQRPIPLRTDMAPPSMSQQEVVHQPRVIQPRRLGGGSPSASSVGPIRAGRNDLNSCRERVWQEAMRRRLLSLDSRTAPLNPDCPSSSGENNKENSRTTMMMALKDGSKKLSRSRKRLNSAELEYENGGGAREGGGSSTIGGSEQQTELINGMVTDMPTPPAMPEQSHQPEQPKQQATQPLPLHQQSSNRRAGRIAYLYGVYGQERQPCAQLLFAASTQQKLAMCTDNDISLSRWTTAESEDGSQRRQSLPHQQCMCCTTIDCKECLLELDRDCMMMNQEEARLHSVSDIIGYAKVVRAQRQETLGRLNDVMSQFDALIRSYSMAMKTSSSSPVTAAEERSPSPPHNGMATQMQAMAQPKAVMN